MLSGSEEKSGTMRSVKTDPSAPLLASRAATRNW